MDRAPSAPASRAPSPAQAAGDEQLVRFGSLRSSGSIPGGNVNGGSGLRLAPGKFRSRSTPSSVLPACRSGGPSATRRLDDRPVRLRRRGSARAGGGRTARRRSSCLLAVLTRGQEPGDGHAWLPAAARAAAARRATGRILLLRTCQPRRTFEVAASATASAYGHVASERIASVAETECEVRARCRRATMPSVRATRQRRSLRSPVACASASYA